MKVVKIKRFEDDGIDRQFQIVIDAMRLPSLPLIPEYATNSAALAAGQVAGDVYHTAGTLKVVIPA